MSYLYEFSKQLNKNLSYGERWFINLYKKHQDSEDKFNEPYLNTIPDIINHKFKYIIEIDGGYHNNLKVQKKDLIKDIERISNGYKCFRIISEDKKSYNKFINELLHYKSRFNSKSKMLYNNLNESKQDKDVRFNKLKSLRDNTEYKFDYDNNIYNFKTIYQLDGLDLENQLLKSNNADIVNHNLKYLIKLDQNTNPEKDLLCLKFGYAVFYFKKSDTGINYYKKFDDFYNYSKGNKSYKIIFINSQIKKINSNSYEV